MLDLFAGTGALGIEALSRGAVTLVAVEQDRNVARLLQANVEHAGFGPQTQVVIQPVLRALEHLPAAPAFDLVLVDPPYREGLVAPVLEVLAARALLAPDGFVLIEHSRAETLSWPPTLALELERPCGDSTITLLRTAQPDQRLEVPAHAHP